MKKQLIYFENLVENCQKPDFIKKFVKKENFNIFYVIYKKMSLKKIKELILQKKIDDALQEINHLQTQNQFEGDIYKSLIMTKKKDFSLALSIIDLLLTKLKTKNDLILEFEARIVKTEIFLKLDRIQEFTEEISISEQILNRMNKIERNNVKEWEGDLLNFKAGMKTKQGDIKTALNLYLESLRLYEEAEISQKIIIQLNTLGWIKRVEGDLDQALEFFQKQLKFSKEIEIGGDVYVSWANYAMGYIYFYKGQLDLALEYSQDSLTTFNKFKIKKGVSYVYSILGSISRVRGELDNGMEFYNKVLALYSTEINAGKALEHSYCIALLNIGKIYYEKNQIENSIEYFKKVIEIHNNSCKERNTILDFYILYVHHSLILASIEIHDERQIEESLEKLASISNNWPAKVAIMFYKKAQATVLKSKNRAKFKIQAQNMFEEILEEHFDYESTFFDQISLCELLINELKLSNEQKDSGEILEEIQKILDQISNNAKNQRSITTLLASYSLQAKLVLIEGNFDESKRLLSQAITIAENKGFHRIYNQLKGQTEQIYNQVNEWSTILKNNSSLQDKIGILNLKKYISESINLVLEEKFQQRKKFEIEYRNFLSEDSIQRSNVRVAIAQIGVSSNNDFFDEYYNEIFPGLFGLKQEKLDPLKSKIKEMINLAHSKEVDILIFPELSIDLNHTQLLEEITNLSEKFNMYIIPGSYHDQKTKRNLSTVISPSGILWEQEKIIPATITYNGERFIEGIERGNAPHKIVIANTAFGRIAVIICRDFLDMDLRVELKNFELPIDLIFNVAFTPVTEDFKAAHFDARRSIYAYCFFANIAEFGNSQIYTPEKDRTERNIPPKEEGIIFKDVNLFELRTERKKWEKIKMKEKSFIQSTRD